MVSLTQFITKINKTRRELEKRAYPSPDTEETQMGDEQEYFREKKGQIRFNQHTQSFLFYPETIEKLHRFHTATSDTEHEELFVHLVKTIAEESTTNKKTLVDKIKQTLYPIKTPPKTKIAEAIDEHCSYITYSNEKIVGHWTARDKTYTQNIMGVIKKRTEFRKRAEQKYGVLEKKLGKYFTPMKKDPREETSALFMPFSLKKKDRLAHWNPLRKTHTGEAGGVGRRKRHTPNAFRRKKTLVLGFGIDEKPPTIRMKLIQFHTDYRPPYYGSKKMVMGINPRSPFSTSPELAYSIDSDEDWQEEGMEGENIESEEESITDDKEEYDEFVVPDGYLSNDEANEDGIQLVQTQNTSRATASFLGPFRFPAANPLKEYAIRRLNGTASPLDPFDGAEVARQRKKAELSSEGRERLVGAIQKCNMSMQQIITEFKTGEDRAVSEITLKREIKTLAEWEKKEGEQIKRWHLKDEN
ncbi:MAG: uncharacterized protein A8A55_0908 [Amphiamblys sp. WSBS2006]|nr:MAG: uncharacterized protein A8A55_0908 [Amphiamblys sp. WSBS2006]